MARPVAYFSTFGGKFNADRANGMKEVIRSDAGDGDDRFIALLRQRFPEECDGIFDQISSRETFQLNAWFDRNDFEAHGVEYLRSVINEIAFENHGRLHKAKEFINGWTKLKAPQVLSTTEPRNACEIFTKEEIDLYGRVFLEKALESIWNERGKEKGEQKGEQKGKEKGKQKGKAARKVDTAPTQLPGGNSHNTAVKADRPVVDVAPIQQPNEAPVQQPDDNSDLNQRDDQLQAAAASINPFGRTRSRSNPEWAVEEEQIGAGATPIQLAARARGNSDVEEWVKTYNLEKILGVTRDPTPAPIDSLSPQLHFTYHVPPPLHLKGLYELLHQRVEHFFNSTRDTRDPESVDMNPYRRSSSLTQTRWVLLHETTTWRLLPDFIQVVTDIEIYPNKNINTDYDILSVPSVASVQWYKFIPRNVRATLPAGSSQHPQALSTNDNNVTRAAVSSGSAPVMYSGNVQSAENRAIQLPEASSSTQHQQFAHGSRSSAALSQQGPIPSMAHHQMQRDQPRGLPSDSSAPAPPRQTSSASDRNTYISGRRQQFSSSSVRKPSPTRLGHNIDDLRTDLYVGNLPSDLDVTVWLDFFRMLPQCRISEPLRSQGTPEWFVILTFRTALEADQAKQILETTPCPLLPRDRQLKIGFPLRKINHIKHSFEQLRRRALAHGSQKTSHRGQQPPADNADSIATPLPDIDRRKENRPPMATTSSSGVEHEMADTAALARRTNEATIIKPEAKHHQPRARIPASVIVPAVPDIHILNRLLIKQKQTEQSNFGVENAQGAMTSGDYNEAGDSPPVSKDTEPSHAAAASKSNEGTVSQLGTPAVSAPKKLDEQDLAVRNSSAQQTSPLINTPPPPLPTDLAVQGTDNSTYDPAQIALATSNTFSQLQDFTNEDPADHPSTESKILAPRSPSPEYSTPIENSPSKKEETDNEDKSSPQGIADPMPSFQGKRSKYSQGDDELYEDSSPPTMDQRHESPSDAIEAEPTAQSSEQIPVTHDSEDPAAQTAEGGAKPTAQSSEQIPIMHDSEDPAAQTAEDGHVPTGDNSGQAVEQDVTRDNDSGAKGQPGEQDASRDNTSGMTDQPEEHDTTQDNTSGVAGQPVEQDAMQDNPTAAAASKAARNKKKNLKRKEKKEREKREADQEVNSSSGTIPSSSTAYGTGAVSFRSERPLDFHAPVALQPGQVHNQPAANSLSQLAHEYHGTFDQRRTIGTAVPYTHPTASTAGGRTRTSRQRAVLASYNVIQDTITELCAKMNLDAGQVAKDMVAERKKHYEEGSADPGNVRAIALLQKQLAAYLKPPIGIKYAEDDVESEFTHFLIDYVRRLGSERNGAFYGANASTGPLAQRPASDLLPLSSIIFPAIPPADSTTPSPLLSKIINNTVHIPNPDVPGQFIPAIHNVRGPSSSAPIQQTYTVQPGDVVRFSPIDASVTAILRAGQYVYRCVPACKRDSDLKARVGQEVSPEMADFWWDAVLEPMTQTWTQAGIDLEKLRKYIAPEMEAMQRTLWEREMQKAADQVEDATMRQDAMEGLEEMSGMRERPFREAETRAYSPYELEGGVGVWLRERRQGDQVELPEDE